MADDTDAIKSPKLDEKNQLKFKYGIIYLSYIPDGLNVKILREIMSQFGEVGRVYLEPEENNRKRYIEGWIEFKKKRVAKTVAKTLNGTSLQYGRKHSKINGQIWSIKYLHKFKWAHLSEQIMHDKAVRDQKRKFQMSQTKKQVDFYQKMTERSKILRMKEAKHKNTDQGANSRNSERAKALNQKQNRPINQGDELAVSVDEDLLSSIFKKVS